MTDETPDWKDWEPQGDNCPSCGKTMLKNHEYDRCYGCASNKRIARDAAKNAGPTARQREKQLEIEALMERDGEVRIELNNDD